MTQLGTSSPSYPQRTLAKSLPFEPSRAKVLAVQAVILDTEAVRKLAANLGIDSVSELARRCGKDRAHLSRVLRGARPAKPSHLLALAAALECDPTDITKAPAA